jgi:hypothetical protein
MLCGGAAIGRIMGVAALALDDASMRAALAKKFRERSCIDMSFLQNKP